MGSADRPKRFGRDSAKIVAGDDAIRRRRGHRLLTIGMIAPVWVPSPPLAYGGVEWLVHWLVEGLVARGHEVVLVGPGDSTSAASRHVVTYDKAQYERLGEITPELVHAVVAYNSLDDCEIIHDHTYAGPSVGAARHPRVIHTVHGNLSREIQWYYASIPRVEYVAISNAQRRSAPALRWLTTVHNAIDVDTFPFCDKKDDHLAFLARINPAKGVVEAIQLAHALGMPLKIAAKLNEPGEIEYFTSVVKPLLGGDIEYVGELGTDDKKKLLGSAKALAFPIQWDEPFGIAMIEALACGTPVLAISRGSVPEIVRDGVTGLTAPDIEALIECARDDLDNLDPQLCREDARKRFDIPRFLDEYERVYLGLPCEQSQAPGEPAGALAQA